MRGGSPPKDRSSAVRTTAANSLVEGVGAVSRVDDLPREKR